MLRSDELMRHYENARANKHEGDGESSGSEDAGIPDESANPAGIRTDGAPSATCLTRYWMAGACALAVGSATGNAHVTQLFCRH